MKHILLLAFALISFTSCAQTADKEEIEKYLNEEYNTMLIPIEVVEVEELDSLVVPRHGLFLQVNYLKLSSELSKDALTIIKKHAPNFGAKYLAECKALVKQYKKKAEPRDKEYAECKWILEDIHRAFGYNNGVRKDLGRIVKIKHGGKIKEECIVYTASGEKISGCLNLYRQAFESATKSKATFEENCYNVENDIY